MLALILVFSAFMATPITANANDTENVESTTITKDNITYTNDNRYVGTDSSGESIYEDMYCVSSSTLTSPTSVVIPSEINGILFSKDGKKLTAYPIGKSADTYTVPDIVVEIAPYLTENIQYSSKRHYNFKTYC